ncbi:MAG: KamA family radical SAM protein, partial [Christensenellales bacterium]
AMYCRHCQRRRRIGEADLHASPSMIDDSIRYVQDNAEIRDVLITGGDPLAMDDDQLESIIRRLRAIPHVEIIRIGTRTPVTMPQRITDSFAKMLTRYHPIYVNTQFNHPAEITPESSAACERLANHGVFMGNQMVLLRGINDDKYIVRLLNQELLRIRVRPYYIFHAKRVVGTHHFKTSIDKGLEIMEYLRGNTSGMAIPTYIVNAPGGLGKTPILPQYLQEIAPEKILLKTWEGRLVEYPNQ